MVIVISCLSSVCGYIVLVGLFGLISISVWVCGVIRVLILVGFG